MSRWQLKHAFEPAYPSPLGSPAEVGEKQREKRMVNPASRLISNVILWYFIIYVKIDQKAVKCAASRSNRSSFYCVPIGYRPTPCFG